MKQLIETNIIKNQLIWAILFVLLLWFLYEIREIIVILFSAFTVTAAVAPFTRILNRKLPYVASVLISYGIVFTLLFVLVFPLFPFFSEQVQQLITTFPGYIFESSKSLGFTVEMAELRNVLGSMIANIGRNAFAITGSLFSGFFTILSIFVISLYLSLEKQHLKTYLINLLDKKMRARVITAMRISEKKLGAWVRGQFILSLAIGFFSWAGLTLLGIPFTLPLALFAGVLEVVPTIGPILSAIPAIIVALNDSFSKALLVAGLYVVIQMLENNFLVPKVMQRSVGLHPIVIIVAVLVGTKLMGFVGALLAVPVVSTLNAVYQSFKENK